MKRISVMLLLLCIGMALFIPCALFTVGNILLAPWPLYQRNRLLLCIFMALWAVLFHFGSRALSHLELRFRQREPRILLVFCLCIFLLQLLNWQLLRHVPFTDTEQIITAADAIARTGILPETERSLRYFTWYPHNLGTVYLYAFLFRVGNLLSVSDPLILLVVFSAGLLSYGLYCSANAAKLLGGYSAELRFLCLAFLCFPFYYCASELYTDALSLPFCGVLIYYFLRLRKDPHPWFFAILFALFGLLGTLVRPTTFIILLACFLSLFFEKRFRLCFSLLLVTLCFLIPGRLWFQHKNEALLGKENLEKYQLPVWHFLAMGLPIHEEDGYGQYGDGSWLILTTSFDDPQERDAVLRSMIKDRVYYLRYPNRLINMVSRKNLSTFGDGSFHLNELIEADAHSPDNFLKQIIFTQGTFFPIYYHAITALFLYQLLLVCIASVQAIQRKLFASAPLFIALFGAFLYLTLWETNARYFFPFMLILLLAASVAERPEPETA